MESHGGLDALANETMLCPWDVTLIAFTQPMPDATWDRPLARAGVSPIHIRGVVFQMMM